MLQWNFSQRSKAFRWSEQNLVWEGGIETELGEGGREEKRGREEGGIGGHVHWTYTREQSHPGVQEVSKAGVSAVLPFAV